MDEARTFPDVCQPVEPDGGPGLAGVLKGVRMSQEELREWPCRDGTRGGFADGVQMVGWLETDDVEAPALISGTRIIEPGRALTADGIALTDVFSPDNSSETTESISGIGISKQSYKKGQEIFKI